MTPETIVLGLRKLYNSRTPIFFSESQLNILNFVVEHAGPKGDTQLMLMITVCAGTGKSFLMIYLKLLYESIFRKNVKVVALTASAAKLIGGNTLHSTFCINEDYAEFYIRNRFQLFTPQQKVIEGHDVIFVDEVSRNNMIYKPPIYILILYYKY